GPTPTESRSRAVTRGNRLPRLSVTITVTSMTLVTRATPVVRPESRLGVRLESYGPVGEALPESYAQARGPVDGLSGHCQIRRCDGTGRRAGAPGADGRGRPVRGRAGRSGAADGRPGARRSEERREGKEW